MSNEICKKTPCNNCPYRTEVSNEKWCSISEQMEMRKTSSKVKKEIFANKYAEKFLSVGGRNN